MNLLAMKGIENKMNSKQELVRAVHEKVLGNSDLDWSEITEKYECGLHPDQ